MKAKAVAPKKEAKKDSGHGHGHGHGHEEKKHAPAGAKALGNADFVINRKWHGKTVEAKRGTHIRIELPENALRGMNWQLQKLPHGVQLEEPRIEQTEQQMTQNRVFDFSVHEEGDYLLQFHLARPFGGQSGFADSFKVKVTAKAD